MKLTRTEVIAEQGKFIHRIGSDLYFSRGTLLQGETAESFEEVDSVPLPKNYDYDERVNSLIRCRYTESQEFAIIRQRESKPLEFDEYFKFCEECKSQVKSQIAQESNAS